MSEDSIQLVIKVPNQKISDQTVECELNWTILRLKTYIFNVFPSNPKVEDQKLIYGGGMLLDNLTLKEVLRNETGQKHTLHLVCASNNSPQNRENEFNSTPSSSQQGTPGTSLHYRGVRQNGENFANTSHTEVPQVQMQAGGGPPINAEMMAQQMAAMQQFYAQYMAQIMQNAQMAGIGTYPNIGFSPMFASAAGAGPQIAEVPNVNANVNAAPANANAAANPIRMNAQGGAVLDEDEDDAENRDWLDWFYIVCRAVVLFSVVYFYSSLGRFMVVFGLSILIYMYQGGWFGNRPVAVAQQNQEVNQPAAVAPNQNEPAQPQENEARENEEPVSSPNVQPNAENEAQIQEELREMQQLMDGDIDPLRHVARPEPTPLQLFWTFFTSFFTSMIPEQPPPPVNIN